ARALRLVPWTQPRSGAKRFMERGQTAKKDPRLIAASCSPSTVARRGGSTCAARRELGVPQKQAIALPSSDFLSPAEDFSVVPLECRLSRTDQALSRAGQ